MLKNLASDREYWRVDASAFRACVWRIATYCQAQQFAHTREAPKKHMGNRKRPD